MKKPDDLRERVEALSDEFGSTFTLFPDGTLANLFHENERATVASLVEKHLGAKTVVLIRQEEVGPQGYALWRIRWEI